MFKSFPALVLTFLFAANANAVCDKVSKSDATIVVELIKKQVRKSPTKHATIDTSVLYENIKDAVVKTTPSGYSEVWVITTYGEGPIDVGYSYLKIEGTTEGILLGKMLQCNSQSPLLKQMSLTKTIDYTLGQPL